jgi:long-chain acyl-CoA synthetase
MFFSVPRLWTKFHQGICAKLPPRRQRLLFRVPIVSSLVRRRILRELGLENVRIALCGSAPLTPVLIDWYRRLGLELLEGYGMSENFAYSHTNRPGASRQASSSASMTTARSSCAARRR